MKQEVINMSNEEYNVFAYLLIDAKPSRKEDVGLNLKKVGRITEIYSIREDMPDYIAVTEQMSKHELDTLLKEHINTIDGIIDVETKEVVVD